MSDFGGLQPFYTEFVPEYLVKRNGKPIGKRAAQNIAKKHSLPLIRVGNTVFIDVARAAELLRAAQLSDRTPRRPGRPRKQAG